MNKKVTTKEDVKVVESVASEPKTVSVRIKKGNTFVLVDFCAAVQGKDFKKIAEQYAVVMGGEIV